MSAAALTAFTVHQLAGALLHLAGLTERPEDLPEVRAAFERLDPDELDEVSSMLEEVEDPDSEASVESSR